ncbi:DUF7344 domain-containing protein [Halopiger djelfimassiliensis]|uniref:DUF7344 domain-containing protein n=1 Tax=Halopiger djelfimassiliensis TaxID=1293047 RepID=UPI000678216A|nr:hypothetical protein [Halopiger djelfimassiliensis]
MAITDIDPVFNALADQQRRRICRYLDERQSPASSDDLVAHLVSDSATRGQPATSSRRRLEISLHHTHLPLLDDADIVEYRPAADRLEPDRNLSVAATILETAAEETAEAV